MMIVLHVVPVSMNVRWKQFPKETFTLLIRNYVLIAVPAQMYVRLRLFIPNSEGINKLFDTALFFGAVFFSTKKKVNTKVYRIFSIMSLQLHRAL